MARRARTPFGNHSATFSRTAALAACAALTLSGCGSVGHDSIPVSVGGAAYGKAGDILLRNVFVLGPKPGQTIPRGGKAALFVALVNDGDRPDRLVRVAAPGSAARAPITGGGLDAPVRRLVGTGPTPSVTLAGLATSLYGSPSLRVTFTFRNAGPVTLDVPVMTATGPYSTFSPSPAPTGTPKR